MTTCRVENIRHLQAGAGKKGAHWSCVFAFLTEGVESGMWRMSRSTRKTSAPLTLSMMTGEKGEPSEAI